MDQSYLDVLRCPMDSSRTATLVREDQHLVCQNCGARYPIRNGIPILVVHEAILPEGCTSRDTLRCRQRPG
ncbi:MAG: hypothetical protein LC104_12965 [Bacteroidales bacterium]|nr:hypothetical protein [Bacteroidales bacterium]